MKAFNITKAVIASLSLFLLPACQTTEEVKAQLKTNWVGKSAGSFFAQYGAAKSSEKQDDGSIAYTWRGGEKDIYFPGSTTTPAPKKIIENKTITERFEGKLKTRTITNEILIPQDPVTTPGRTYHEVCEAEIIANKAGIITQINIRQDSMGDWNINSRCSEMFKTPR